MNKDLKKRSKKGKIVLLVGVLLLSSILLFEAYYNFLLDIKMSDVRTVDDFVVDGGEGVESITERLYSQNFIKSKYFFLTYLSRENLDQKVQAGHHTLSKDMTMKEVAEALLKSKRQDKVITILEGWQSKEIIDYLVDNGYDKEAILKCIKTCDFEVSFLNDEIRNINLEGFIFPDTYHVSMELDPKEILNKSLVNFEAKLNQIKQERPSLNDLYSFSKEKSLYEHVIVASMIEREVRGETDRKIVSGIIWKRLMQNMGLGIDATLLYVLGDWKAEITYEDLQKDSPYNTRKKLGLPPTPISSPSYTALLASFYPEDSEYLYYLTPDSGEVIYSKTLEEHNRNKRQYLN